MLRVCGGKTHGTNLVEAPEEIEKEVKVSCAGRIAPHIINPKSFYKLLWDTVMGGMYLLCYLIDPFIIVFMLEPLQTTAVSNLQHFLTFVLVFDMMLKPLTA